MNYNIRDVYTFLTITRISDVQAVKLAYTFIRKKENISLVSIL